MSAKLDEIIRLFEGKIPKNQLDDYLLFSKAGEESIALENLCTQIDEYGIKISASVFETIRSACASEGLDSKYFEWLTNLVDD